MSARIGWSLAGFFAVLLAAVPGRADWRDDIGVFRIGMLAEPGSDGTVAGLADIRNAYAMALGIPVEIFVAESYAALIDAQVDAKIDYAIYSTTAYALASLRCGCVEPLAAPVGADGAVGIRSVLIARDGLVETATGLPSARTALGPPGSVAARDMPLASIEVAGATLRGDEPFLVTVSSASEAETMLRDGAVDAMFGWEPSGGADSASGTVIRLTQAGMETSRLKVIWRSEPLRYGPHTVRKTLDAEPRKRLLTFLTLLKDRPEIYDLIEPNRLGGFEAVSETDYASALWLLGPRPAEVAAPDAKPAPQAGISSPNNR